MSWPPSEWDQYIGGFGAPGMTPHAPPVAPADEWNDGAGPAANAEIAAADLAAVRSQMQQTADKTLGPTGGRAFADGIAQEQLNAISGEPVASQARHWDPKYGWINDSDVASIDRDAVPRAVEDLVTNVAGKEAGRAVRDANLDRQYPRIDYLKSNEQYPKIDYLKSEKPLLASAPRDRAYIAQATGPTGTIDQIGESVDGGGGSSLPLGDMSTLSRDLAASEPAGIEMPDDYVGTPTIGRPTRITEMPDDFVGQVDHEMPDDYVGNGSTRIIEIPSAPFSSPAGLEPVDPYGPGYVSSPSGLLTPPILGQPDAISGGATAAQSLAEQQAAKTKGPVSGQTAGRPGPMPDEYLDGDELGVRMSGRSPEEQALFRNKVEQAKKDHAAIRQMEEIGKNRRAMEDNLRVRSEAAKVASARRAENDAEAKRIADQNPTDSIPAYRKIAGVLAAFVGGFAANKTGRNMGLEVVEQIAQEAAQQQAQRLSVLAKKRQGIGEDMAGADDAYRAAEQARLATYDLAITGLQAELQKYDQRGTTAVSVMNDIAQIRAERGKIAAANEQQDFKNTLDFVKHKLEEDKLAIEAGKADAEIAYKNAQTAKLGAGGTGAGKLSSTGYFDPTSSKWIPFPEGIKLGVPERGKIRDVGVHYVKYRAGLQQLKSLVDEVKQSTLKGRVSDGWRSTKEHQYNSIATMMAYQQAKMADPTSVVRAEELAAFRKVLPMPSSIFGHEYEAADGVYKALTDAADSNYAAEIRGYGLDPNEVIGSVHGKERDPQGPPSSLELEKSIAPDYVPGHVFDVGPESDVVSGMDSYIRNFADNRVGGTTDQLRSELGALVDKNRSSLKKAESDLAKAQKGKDKNAAAKALEVRNRWRTIVTDHEARLKTLDVDQKRAKDKAQTKRDQAAAAAAAAAQRSALRR